MNDAKTLIRFFLDSLDDLDIDAMRLKLTILLTLLEKLPSYVADDVIGIILGGCEDAE